jgi:hypothetical protein
MESCRAHDAMEKAMSGGSNLTPAEVAALVSQIDALAEKALPQPWSIDPDDRPGMHWNNQIVQASNPNMAVCFMTHDNTPENEEGQANAELIVALVNAWPALSAALTQLAAERKDAERIDALELMRATVYASVDEGRLMHWVVVDETKRARRGNVAKSLRDAIDATLPAAPQECKHGFPAERCAQCERDRRPHD